MKTNKIIGFFSLFCIISLAVVPLKVSSAQSVTAPFTNCASQTEIPLAECEALVALYNNTDGINWTNNTGTGWLQTDTPCSWYGVTCLENHVIRLNLTYNLSGTIPDELGNLSNLQSLYLGGNQLSGPIPPQLGNLSNLQNLNLAYNQLSGTIPDELGNLSNLQSLSLGGNQLSGPIPPQLGNLSNLKYLYLHYNQLSGAIPPELGNLTNLQYLYLGGNQLSGPIPAEIGNLSNLIYIGLTNNQQLNGEFPASITLLENLIRFDFDTCGGLSASDPDTSAFLDAVAPSGWSDCPKDFVIEGKYHWIKDGSSTVYKYNGTDFGNVVINSPRSNVYQIYNQSPTALYLTGRPRVQITGSSAFAVISPPGNTVYEWSSTSFSILFNPQSAGIHTAIVSIANTSSAKNPYTFTIQGIGVWDDAYEKDNDFNTAKVITPDLPQTRSLYPSSQDKDFVQFNLTSPMGIALETSGEMGYDTELALYDENHVLKGYDNDGGELFYSKINKTCADPLPAGTYYALVYNYEGIVPQYQLDLTVEDCPPTVASVTRASASPTTASSVDLTVTFSEDVTGVDTNGSDFTLTASPSLSGADIIGVTPVSDSVYTVSVNTGSGSGTLRLDVLEGATIQDTANKDLSGLPFTSGEDYIKTSSITYKSNSTDDGWVLESTENSSTGGSLDNTASTFILGDNAQDRQYRAILHFDTSALPDNAVITSASIKLLQHSISGSSPFSVLGSLFVDMRNPSFGLSTLELGDFSTAAKKVKMGIFNPTPVSGWYSVRLTSGGRLYINRTGTTQFRLYFSIGDNDDLGADFIRFFSGNATAAKRPKLLIQYYVP